MYQTKLLRPPSQTMLTMYDLPSFQSKESLITFKSYY